MPLPGREQTFGFADCRELLDKLEREIDRYREMAGRDPSEHDALFNLVNQLKDSAFNASVTAWHLSDWVFNDMTQEQRQELGLKELGDLQNYAREKCRAMHLCRQAATASKHWTVSKHSDPTVQVTVTCDDTDGWIVYFVHEGNKISADRVFDEALAFWTGYIYQHNIAQAADYV
jgi:hypothetical protein